MKPRFNSFTRSIPKILFLNSLFCLFLFLNPVNILGQESTRRPTVGLALSGGGAHGIAHLGVLKVMEEAGLRPDYITGVSMGSIIGGLYSIGYSADSIHKMLNEINWELILSNKIPENHVIYLEKAHFYHSIISIPISGKKFILPSGLISGQQIENLLSFYAWPAAGIDDFSRLPIPFSCLATDIKSFNKIEIKTGYLADAIRASISVPSIFTPLKIDSLLLLDGGLTRNFPASEVREMGADIVIGSYTGFPPFNDDEVQSVQGIMKQIAFSRGLDDFEKQKRLVDLLIKPDVGEFSRSGFENVDSIMQKGYDAAMPFRDYFRKLADSLNRFGAQKPMEDIFDIQYYTFNKIEIEGNKIYSDLQILGVLDIDPEEKIDRYQLTDKIELLYGNAWFEKVKYRIVPRNDSLILVIDCIEKPQAMFYASAHYDNSLLFGLILETSVKNLLTPRSVININSFIGQYYRFEFNYIQFIDRHLKFGLSANFYADNTPLHVLELRGIRGKVISRNIRPGLSINRRLGLNQLMSVSAYYENLDLRLQNDSEVSLKNISYNYLTTSYDYNINTVDSQHFPDRGTILNISASISKLFSGSIQNDSSEIVSTEYNNDIFSFDRFFTLYGNIKYYFSPSDNLTFEIGGDALFITDSDSVSAQNNPYLLGGIISLNKRSIPLIGFYSNEIPVEKMVGIRTEADYKLFRKFHVNVMANVFLAEDIKQRERYSLFTSYGLGVGYMSIVGPLRIGLMNGNSNPKKYLHNLLGYFSLGYNF
jgi:NTE family protein